MVCGLRFVVWCCVLGVVAAVGVVGLLGMVVGVMLCGVVGVMRCGVVRYFAARCSVMC